MEKAKDTKAKEAAKEEAAKEKQSHIHSTKEINAHNDNKKVTLCMKYNAGECRRGDGCHLLPCLLSTSSKRKTLHAGPRREGP